MPLATLSAAQAKLNAGGTLHVGEGTFTDSFTLSGYGTKIIGAGRGRTTIRTTAANGITVSGHGQVVADLAVDGPTYGVCFAAVDGANPTNVTVRGCEIRNCKNSGIYMAQDRTNDVQYTNFVSHCVISNCTSFGIRCAGMHAGSARRGNFICDNTLLAYNGQGYWSDFQPSSAGDNNTYFVNCTVVSNRTAGVKTGTSQKFTVRNCILFDNGTCNVGATTYALTFDHSICNAMISAVEATYVESYASHNPKLGADFTLTRKSYANKSGEDVSGELPSLWTDLTETSWAGAYDMGCYKSGWPKYVAPTYDEVWVSVDGDNDNEGDTPDAPVATLATAQLRLKAGGTLHVGPGTYTDSDFTLYGNGARMLGSGAERTIIRISTGCGTIVAGHSSLVEGIAYEGGKYGVRIGEEDKDIATNCTVRGCVFRRCATGWYAQQDSNTDRQFTNFVSHCTFSNCTPRALHWQGLHSGSARMGHLLADTCLIASNAVAFYSDVQYPAAQYNSFNRHTFVNCTVVSNASCIALARYLSLSLFNCLFADNGASCASLDYGGTLTVCRQISNGTLSATTLKLDAQSVTNLSGLSALKLDRRAGHEFQPTLKSPARKFGDRALSEGVTSTDLVGRPIVGRQIDAGCCFCDRYLGLRVIVR